MILLESKDTISSDGRCEGKKWLKWSGNGEIKYMGAKRRSELRVKSPSHFTTWRIQPTRLRSANCDIAHADCGAFVEWANQTWSN